MTTANYFFSSSMPNNQDRPYSAPGVAGASAGPVGSLNSGTASYASDALEIRITTNSAGYTPTKKDVVDFLDQVHRWVEDQRQGLDALLLANSATVGIP
jgi:hypothetical protein